LRSAFAQALVAVRQIILPATVAAIEENRQGYVTPREGRQLLIDGRHAMHSDSGTLKNELGANAPMRLTVRTADP